MNFEELIQLQVLKLKATAQGRIPGRLADALIESGELQAPELKQMCAKVTQELYARLENVTSALDMSKREFIEAAVMDAIVKAEDAIERSGAFTQGDL
jgi:hypothetical protein